jgi:hypothetical protein
MGDSTIAPYNPCETGESLILSDAMEHKPRDHRTRRTWIAAAAGLLMLALTVGVVSAQGPTPPMPTMPMPEQQSEGGVTHEQMHQMMDAMHGEGMSDRMHETMGEDAERMMDQCIAMMNMMTMMNSGGESDFIPDMMRRMLGR